MWAVTHQRRCRAWPLMLVPCFLAASVVACGDEPDAFTISVATSVDSVKVTWAALANVDSFKVQITSNPTFTKWVSGSATEGVFTSADGVEDEIEYTATVTAVNAGGETVSTNSPTVTSNFFPWDEYFETSLHLTGQGKQTWYNANPNQGFERFTGEAYANISCKTCHEEATRGRCERCHTDVAPGEEPGLGATIASDDVCIGCHGRQGAEINLGFTDVHRTAGFRCMDCHSMGDVHGDGTAYNSMLEDGAIDAKCENCHVTGGQAGPPPSNSEHNLHLASIDCSTCHMQTVVTCHNCHFETEIAQGVKKFFGPPPFPGPGGSWLFMVNRNGKVHPANFQSVKFGAAPNAKTFMALAPFYGHTITASGRTCGDCHDNANIADYNADGAIAVTTWNGTGFDRAAGAIPVPPDYLTALKLDFADLDGTGNWVFLETGPDTIQLMYGTPLTASQMVFLGSTR